jgi:heme-degrading monooxygenase HmoA
VIARVVRATARSEHEAKAMVARWRDQIGPLERSQPGFRGGVVLCEGPDLLAVSCWDDPTAVAALDPRSVTMARTAFADLLAKPLSCRLRTL